MKIYIGGALANPEVVRITKLLQDAGHEAFSEWYTPGPDADVLWRDYELALGYDYREALRRPAAQNIFHFDKRYIDASDALVMVLPAGKSAHLELGYAVGRGKRGFIYMPEQPDKWDIMYSYAEAVVYNDAELLESVKPSLAAQADDAAKTALGLTTGSKGGYHNPIAHAWDRYVNTN